MRPKLVKSLQRHGGIICTDARDAHIVLVEPSTDEGKRLVRFRGQSHPVLDYRWARRCMDANRMLDVNENWGGYLVHDDGAAIPSGSVDDADDYGDTADGNTGDAENSLPTPRITPTNAMGGPSAGSSSYAGQRYPVHFHGHPANNETAVQGLRMQHATQISQTPMYGGLPATPSTSYSMSQITMPTPEMTNPQAMIPFSQMAPHMSPPVNQLMALISSPQIQAQFQSMLMENIHAQGPQHNPFGSAPTTANNYVTAPGPTGHGHNHFPTSFSQPSTQTSPQELHATSSNRSRKGKGRLDLEKQSDSDTPTPGTSDSAFEVKSYLKGTSPHKAIFTNERGNPLTFFVQVDLKDRKSIVSNIKKYGGTISNSNTTADYSILYSGSKTFQQLLSGTIDAKRPAVRAAFIHDSISRGKLLDFTPYHFDIPVINRKKRSASSPSENKKKRRVSSQIKTEEPEVKPLIKPQIGIRSMTKKPSPSLSVPSQPLRSTPSPTPPPESSKVLMQPGKYRYSEEEREYMLTYTSYLFQHDPSVTSPQLAQKLFNKMPHHSLSSWVQYVQNNRDDIEAIRKRVGIARRKAQQEQERRSRSQPFVAAKRESSSPTVSATSSDAFNTDLERICRFFASGDSDNISDDEAWIVLSRRYECITATSWPAFYDQHHRRVYKRVTELASP